MDSPGPVAYRRTMDEHASDPTVPGPEQRTPAGWLPEAVRWKRDTLRRTTVHGVRLCDPGEL